MTGPWTPPHGAHLAGVETEVESMARPLVYLVVALGLIVNLAGLLVAHPQFGLGTIAIALLIAGPYLLFARLAIARPGADAVIGGVLLLAIDLWGSVAAITGGRTGETSTFVQLAVDLVLVELAVFATGSLLRPGSSMRGYDKLRG